MLLLRITADTVCEWWWRSHAPTANLIDLSGVDTMKKGLKAEQIQLMPRLFGMVIPSVMNGTRRWKRQSEQIEKVGFTERGL
jgi:hypothetical protein